jgi:predicted DNA-binding transcriptional regulator AlpA
MTLQKARSRAVLVHQIDLRLIDRQGAAVTKFAAIYRLIDIQKFPSPVRLGPRAVA